MGSGMKRGGKFFVERRMYARGVAIHLVEDLPNGCCRIAKPVEFEPVLEDGAAISDPFMLLRDEQAQQLMDELWMAGYRPAKGSQGEGEREAMKAHLCDMRAMVKKLAKVDLP
jgi:hypothetical protein